MIGNQLFGGLGCALYPNLLSPGEQYRRQFGISSNYCPCCGASRLQNIGLFGQLAMLQDASNQPKRKLPSDKELKDRFDRLSHDIDDAVERYGLAS